MAKFKIDYGVLESYIRENDETEITIPEGVEIIKPSLFSFSYDKLKIIHFPKTLREIDMSLFHFCRFIERITIDTDNENFSIIDGVLFTKDMTKLIWCFKKNTLDYSIPDTVIEIGKYAFEDCNKLCHIKIPESVKKIGKGAFINCVSLKELNLPDSIEEIEKEAFSGCASLKKVIIPKLVTKIDSLVFDWCDKLEEIVIHKDVKEIIQGSMNCCHSLENILIAPENKYYYFEDEILYTKDMSKIIFCIERNNKKDLVIKNTVKEIGSFALCSCKQLKTAKIADSVEVINKKAFFCCHNLESIIIPASVKEIGIKTFAECPKLIIYTPKGSYAEEYAKKNEILFKNI